MTDSNQTPAASTRDQINRGWLTIGLVFFGLYAFATLVPRGDTWGLHALAYLPPILRILGLTACLLLLWRPFQQRVIALLETVVRPLLQDSIYGKALPLVVAVVGFVVFYSFPIKTEVYGDTRTILREWTDNAQIRATWMSGLLDFHLLKNDAALTQVLHRTVAHIFAIPIEQAFRLVSAVAGALCLCLWTAFVRSMFSSSRWGALLLLAGYGLGANQIFFGHVETYAFVFLAALALLLTGYLLLEGRASIWTVLLLFVFTVKAHTVAIYFLPAVLFLIAFSLSRRFSSVARLLTWRRLLPTLIAPSLVIGAGLYFFYFKSYNAPHQGASGALPQTFLPIFPAPPPLGYSLLTLSHFADFGNVLLLVGAPVVVALVGLLLLHRRAVDWQHPSVVFATLALLFPLMFFAAVNPLLSMPRDWDLYALLAGPMLLFFSAVLAHSDDSAVPAEATHGATLGFVAFSVGFWIMNASPSALSLRLEAVGEHIFRTYHTNASYLIGSAQGMESDTSRGLARREATVRRLAPVVVGEDEEYTHLLTMLASAYRERGDRVRALFWVRRATAVAPSDLNLSLYLADYLLWAERPAEAQECVAAILRKDGANFSALVLGAIAAARLDDLDVALNYLVRADAVSPHDADVTKWIADIKARQFALAHPAEATR